MARVSIVIPAFNAGRYIRQTLKSVIASSWGDFEVILIDDGSSDDTVVQASGLDLRIRIISRPNAGMSAARNLGEFGCPFELALALLEPAARESGLPPSDIRRQIQCGLTDEAKKGGAM